MKQSTQHSPPVRRGRRGMALVMVLVIVSLLMTLVLAMLSMGSSEARSASAFSQTNQVRSLGEMPSTIVMGQIREATSKLEMASTWASQPGMIRRFGTEATSIPGRAALEKVWRLYSSPKMTEEGKGFDATKETDTLATWSANPALFTDLNEPVATIRADGTVAKSYPIIDKNALPTTGVPSDETIEGFGLASSSGAPGTSDLHPLPMPVSWLYVLQDGKMIAPVSGSGTTARFKSGDITSVNPIVGRIAFWTDDETCKVNINTASEGTLWDIPRTKGATDVNYATRPPGHNEFQRFPGHPATTCLSPVLQAFDPKYAYQIPTPLPDGTISNKVAYQQWLKGIYDLTPKTHFGTANTSSMGGTSIISNSDISVPFKRDRLFSSVDEFFFGTGYDDVKHLRKASTSDGAIDSQELEMGRFFLTAHSRAPEVNLYNRPRISLWPLQADTAKRVPQEKLMAYCSTTKGQLGAFLRATTFDKDTSDLKPCSSQSTTEDFLLPSNQKVFNYLQKLTKAGVPGFGSSSFDDKYDSLNRNQILLEAFDLIRTGINSRTKTSTVEMVYITPDRLGKIVEPPGKGSAAPVVTDGPSGNTFPKTLRAFGRFPSVVEVAVVFMTTNPQIKPKANEKDPDVIIPPSPDDVGAAKAKTIQAFLILQPFTPVAGAPHYSPAVRYRIKGLEKWKVNGKSLGFPDDGVNRLWSSKARDLGRSTPHAGLFDQYVTGNKGKIASPGGGDENETFPFVSAEIDISDSASNTFEFTGGDITIETHVATGSPGGIGGTTLVQSSAMTFPNASAWPNPTLQWAPDPKKVTSQYKPANTSEAVARKFMSVTQRLSKGMASGEWLSDYLIVKGDVVRSVVVSASPQSPIRGDYRMLSAMREVPASAFTPHPDYASSTKTEAQSLRDGRLTNEHFGRAPGPQSVRQVAGYESSPFKSYGLLRDITYGLDCQPVGPIKLDGAYNLFDRPGDWDTGIGSIEDGPYINKPSVEGLGEGVLSRLPNDNYKEMPIFSPNQQLCSGVVFGSLPSGVHPLPGQGSKAGPWQTLLFCPNPPSRSTAAGQEPNEEDHWGFKPPRDHLLLDHFWIPVVEPYAISEPFSTAGKVNLNTQMMPFSYIRRDTGLCAVLRNLRIAALPAAVASTNNPKKSCYKVQGFAYDVAYQVNTEETLKGLHQRFNAGDIYRSASEICDIFLVPKKLPGREYASPSGGSAGANPAYSDMVAWWNGDLGTQNDGYELTGDNLRESPYNQIYSRLTTKSNTFTVHHRVQVLKKARSTAADEWDESKDRMVAETRGSTLIERYIDPNDSQVPNFIADPTQAGALDDYYRFRVILRKTFAP